MIIPEFKYPRVPLERCLHDPTLNAVAAAVNEPDLLQARRCRRVDILGDNRGNIARREGMKIELVFDRNSNGLFRHTQLSALGFQPLALGLSPQL
jgi:hypothetical protein